MGSVIPFRDKLDSQSKITFKKDISKPYSIPIFTPIRMPYISACKGSTNPRFLIVTPHIENPFPIQIMSPVKVKFNPPILRRVPTNHDSLREKLSPMGAGIISIVLGDSGLIHEDIFMIEGPQKGPSSFDDLTFPYILPPKITNLRIFASKKLVGKINQEPAIQRSSPSKNILTSIGIKRHNSFD
ncbi:uncharacterized protein G2W53_027259 [Senna tora]|uniref:Uncharacterized protein n=1 Tax=Senna tora TaxID=362788 RepID=A0A834TQJ3_9FABA|nr:uncharacterized protein G2W53_027259 [Senna tora]